MERNILLIDDEASLRRTLSLNLLQRGYVTEPCENGINALKKLALFMRKGIPPDIVVVDFKLPDINGVNLVKIIKVNYPHIPIILITAYKEQLNPDEITELNINGFLEKPFSPEELIILFDKILEKQDIEKPAVESEKRSESKPKSAYLFIRTGENCDFFEVYQKLYFMEDVVYCDALKGDYGICLLIQAEGKEKLKKVYEDRIKTITGLKEIDILRIENPIFEDNINNIVQGAEKALSTSNLQFGKGRDFTKRVCSYVLIEIEKEKLETIYLSLLFCENVVHCDYIRGKSKLVLFMYGRHFGEIDKIIEEKIINIDGILKVKEYPIINILEM